MIYELLKDRIMNGGAGSEAIIESLSISANGVYTASSGIDGYSPITVNVPQEEPSIQSLSISANGTYNAPADVDGYNPITVNVPQKEPSIQNLSITANGTYTAPSGTDGYSPVVVDVQPNLENITITANGTYSHAGKDGYDQVVVNVPQQGITELVVPSLEYLNYQGRLYSLIDRGLKTIKIHNTVTSAYGMFNMTDNINYSQFDRELGGLTITTAGEYNCNITNMNWAFNNSSTKELPIFDSSIIISNSEDIGYIQAFKDCGSLRHIPEGIFPTQQGSKNGYSGRRETRKLFYNCQKLREIPSLIYFNGINSNNGSNSFYNQCFYSCRLLDEIVDIPVPANSHTSNAFSDMLYSNWRVKKITFVPNQTANMTNQTIEIYVGYFPSSYTDRELEQYYLDAETGVTMDTRVVDATTYEALKNNPNWWTSDVAYSRYNHNSAVETINSLPDTSAYLASNGGTNTIKFLGASGSATDGGAISTLTAEEIAVATAKGWTVTLV